MHHELVIHDGAVAQEQIGQTVALPAPQTYEVVRPIFKRGREWRPGDVLDLDPTTAVRFLEAGDIKEHT